MRTFVCRRSEDDDARRTYHLGHRSRSGEHRLGHRGAARAAPRSARLCVFPHRRTRHSPSGCTRSMSRWLPSSHGSSLRARASRPCGSARMCRAPSLRAKRAGPRSSRAPIAGSRCSSSRPARSSWRWWARARPRRTRCSTWCAQLLALDDVPRPDHAADALAAAICYTTHEGFAQRTGAACVAYDSPNSGKDLR